MKPHQEEYITTIFKLNARTGNASNKDISRWLKVAPSSVTEMTRKLERDGLVKHSHSKIELTEKGLLLAEKILSKHRLWELFLQQVLDYDWQDVHEQAKLLQYSTSDHLMEKLNKFLNYPPHCPHGGIIFLNDKGEAKEMTRLSEAEPGSILEIRRIADNKELLEYIDHKNLAIGKKIKLLSFESFDHTALIEFDEITISLSEKACEQIFVSPVA